MSAGGWFGLAAVAWNLGWALAVWLRDRRRDSAFRKCLANSYRLPWE